MVSPLIQETIDSKYNYVIIARDTEENYKNSLVYKQLQKVQSAQNDSLRIKVIIPPQDQKFYRYFFLLKLKDSVSDLIADKLNLKLFNRKKGYNTQFIQEERHHFEPLRVFHSHKILLYVLNREFSMDVFQKKGLIEDHFPLHSFRNLRTIRKLWTKEKYSTLFDPLKNESSSKDLLPYNSIAFYYGCDVALYLSFNCVYTSWLLLIAIIGIIFYATSFALQYFMSSIDSLNNFLTPIYVILVSIWVTIAFEKWKRRQFELTYVWNTIDSEINRIEKIDYQGTYIIDKVTKKIRQEAKFSTNKRIWLLTIPLLIIGISLLSANFVVFVFLSDTVRNDDTLGFIKQSIYLAIIGSCNGTIIFIFTVIYNFCSKKAVQWENHRFENTEEKSMVMKTFIFEFLIAYLNLFYYAFIKKDFALLSTNFVTIVLTKNLLFNLTSNILPWILFRFKKFLFQRKWKAHRKSIKKLILKELKIDYKTLKDMDPEKAFKELKPETQRLLLENEKEILIQEQTQFTLVMSKLPDMRQVWTNYAIQFGYIAFFSMAFPLAPIIGYLMNVFDLHFQYFALSNHLQRKPAVEKSGIGIWNTVFEIMSYTSLIVNLSLMAVADNGIKNLLIRISPSYFEKYYSTLILVIILLTAEHIILMLKYMIDLAISDIPAWVREEIKERKNLEYLDDEKIKRKYNKIKSKRKLMKKAKNIRKSIFSKIHEIKVNIDRQKTFESK
jgi:anoctamin-10